jgi:transcription termination factor nusA
LARKSTKEKNDGKAFLQTLKELAYEKGIDEEQLFDTIKDALTSAYRRNFNLAQNDRNVRIALSRETGAFHVFAIKDVVEEVTNDVTEISLAQARAISPDYVVGDVVEIEMTPANFGRIAAQTAKQVVMQRLREAERGIVYDEYMNRKADIVTGIVQRVEGRNVFVDIGRAEALLMATEQMPTEEYNYGDTLRAYIIEVKRTVRGPQILLSRTHPELLKKLFELQVPEMQEGVVAIKSIAREAGSRSKVAVYSSEERVDPIGACVGPHYMRVQAVVDELAGEKIDIVKWSDDPATYIANSLNPAKVISVAVNEAEKVSRVIVPDYQLSLAIGKEGQNARLAAKLTGWKIDIKSESQAQELMEAAEVAEEDSVEAASPAEEA